MKGTAKSTRAFVLFFLLVSSLCAPAAPASFPDRLKPRIVVMTDIGGDPDDRQSIVRFLLYACDFHVEGLCTGFGWGHEKRTRPDLLRLAVEAYGKVLPSLRKHRRDYPSRERLLSLIKDGFNGDPHKVGPGMDSEASEWIIKVVDREDPRPVWFSIWGGPRELAQAIWKVQTTRSAAELAAFKRKIRVHSIADQDHTALWVKKNHPDVFWIYSKSLYRGIWQYGDQSIVSRSWLKKHVYGHGPLGELYPPKAAGKDGVKEGDTPSFFYVLPNGLSDPEHPEWGGWGGRFARSGRGNEYLPAEDFPEGVPDIYYTIYRWRPAFQNEFEARMDWCVQPYEKANHEPSAVLNGDRSRRVLEIDADPNAQISLSAAGSTDPDGDDLNYKWWIYREAGTYWGAPPIGGARTPRAAVKIPANASGRTIHVILEITDTGRPPLTAYRRAIIKVSGRPVPPPPDAFGVPEDLSTPVTKLSGPPGPWRFFRGININGPPVVIDGNRWEGDNAPDFKCTERALINTEVKLRPPTDPEREKMIRSFRWNRTAIAELTRVPKGKYAVYLYVWEETESEILTFRLNGKIVRRNYRTGPRGRWKRLGPWMTRVANGRITIKATGGAANLSGIEVWRRR